MIFVTVGTHEQQFDRLVRKVDELKESGVLEDEVVVQTGYSTFHPDHCRWKQWFDYDEMCECMEKARIIVTHGGPASFLPPIRLGKMPVVVPRQKQYAEHVNDHQVEFTEAVREMGAGIILTENIDELGDVLADYDRYAVEAAGHDLAGSNNLRFNQQLEELTESLFS